MAEKVVPLHSHSLVEPTLYIVRMVEGREYYILKCVAEALILTIRDYNNLFGSMRIANRRNADTPLFFCSSYKSNNISPIMGVETDISFYEYNE